MLDYICENLFAIMFLLAFIFAVIETVCAYYRRLGKIDKPKDEGGARRDSDTAQCSNEYLKGEAER